MTFDELVISFKILMVIPNNKKSIKKKSTGPNCCGPNWPDLLKNASGPAAHSQCQALAIGSIEPAPLVRVTFPRKKRYVRVVTLEWPTKFTVYNAEQNMQSHTSEQPL